MEIRRNTVVFENAGPEGWGAFVPDLPGCTAAGRTFEDTIRGVQQSIELWIGDASSVGEPIPPASTEALSVSVAI